VPSIVTTATTTTTKRIEKVLTIEDKEAAEIIKKSQLTHLLAQQYFDRVNDMNNDILELLNREKEIQEKFNKQMPLLDRERAQRIEVETKLRLKEVELAENLKNEDRLSRKLEQLKLEFAREIEIAKAKQYDIEKITSNIKLLDEELKMACQRVHILETSKQENSKILEGDSGIKRQHEEELRHAQEVVTKTTERLEKLQSQLPKALKREQIQRIQLEKELLEKEERLHAIEAEKHKIVSEKMALERQEKEIEEKHIDLISSSGGLDFSMQEEEITTMQHMKEETVE